MVQALEAQGRAQVERGEFEAGFALLQRALVMRRGQSEMPQADPSSAAAKQVAGYVRDPMRRGMLFTRPGDVFMMDPDGTHEIRVTHSPEHWNDHPAWASDGLHVLLSRFVGGDRDDRPDDRGRCEASYSSPRRRPGWNDMVPVPLDDGVVFERIDPAEEGELLLRPTGRIRSAPAHSRWSDHDPAPVPGGGAAGIRE